MNISYKFIFAIELIATALFIQSCIDIPDETALPRWDTNLKAPIADTVYTLMDAIKDDTLFTYGGNAEDPNLIYYSQRDTLNPVEFEDKLTLSDKDNSFSHSISSIRIQDESINSQTDIPTGNWISGITVGASQNIPATLNRVTTALKTGDNYSRVTYDNGLLILSIFNNQPFDVEIRSFAIVDDISGEEIISDHNTIAIAMQDSVKLEYNLTGKEMSNTLRFIADLFTGGTSYPVYISSESGFVINTRISDMSISSLTARIPDQPTFMNEAIIPLDDSSAIYNAVFKSGRIEFTITNNFNVAADVILSVPELLKADGMPYMLETNLPANSVRVIREDNISGWSVALANADSSLHCNSYITARNSAGQMVTISKGDGIDFQFASRNIILSSASGYLKPVSVKIKNSVFSIQTKNIDDKLDYSGLKLSPASVMTIEVGNYTQAECLFNGEMKISNGNSSQDKTVQVTNVLLLPDRTNSIDLREFGMISALESFSEKLPNRFEFSGEAQLNPQSKNITIEDNDVITEYVQIDLPFELSIDRAVITDTIDVNIDSEEPDKVLEAYLDLNIENGIPAELKLTADVIDAQGNLLFTLPTSYSEIDTIRIPSAETDQYGNVSKSSKSLNTVKLLKREAVLLMTDARLVMHLSLSTKTQGLVRLHTDDYIRTKITGRVKYHISE